MIKNQTFPLIKSILRRNNKELVKYKCLQMILEIIRNIVQNPNIKRFQKLIKTNQILKTNILEVNGGFELLKHIGFEEKDLNIEEEEEGDEWITSENINRIKNGTQVFEEKWESKEKDFQVGVITTDFAMQNVLLHLGIQIVSIDGMRIKILKQWVKRCHGCSTLVPDVRKIFCIFFAFISRSKLRWRLSFKSFGRNG